MTGGHFLASSQIGVYPIIKLYGAQRLVNVARRFNRHLQMLEINHPRGLCSDGMFHSLSFTPATMKFISKALRWRFRLKEGGRSLTHFALKSSFEWPAISSDPCYSVSGWVPQKTIKTHCTRFTYEVERLVKVSAGNWLGYPDVQVLFQTSFHGFHSFHMLAAWEMMGYSTWSGRKYPILWRFPIHGGTPSHHPF